MPRKPLRPCAHPGCPKLVDGRFCPAHDKQDMREYNRYRRDPETRKRYGSAWRKIRARYIALHPICEACLREGRYTPAEHVHHKIELSNGGTHDDENLCSLCKHHHSSIHLSERNKAHHG